MLDIHVWFSRFSLLSLPLSCSSCARGTAAITHSSITTHKAGWYLQSLPHEPVKTCFFLFRTLGSFQPTTALLLPPGIPVLSLAVMVPYTRLQLHQMKFLFRVAIIHAKRERTGSSLLSSLVLSLHTSTEDLCSKFVPCKSSSIKLSTCKSTFACAITSVSSQIWHTPLWAHPRQVGVHLCTLLYRTVWSTIV